MVRGEEGWGDVCWWWSICPASLMDGEKAAKGCAWSVRGRCDNSAGTQLALFQRGADHHALCSKEVIPYR